MITRCPKCRALGLSHDCADRLVYGQQRMNDDGTYELEVTVTFAVPITSSLPLDPHEMATHMRERWVSEDDELADLLAAVVHDDYDLQVKPMFVA